MTRSLGHLVSELMQRPREIPAIPGSSLLPLCTPSVWDSTCLHGVLLLTTSHFHMTVSTLEGEWEAKEPCGGSSFIQEENFFTGTYTAFHLDFTGQNQGRPSDITRGQEP